MIPVNEELLVNAIEKVSKNVVNIASVRMVTDELLRIFPIEGVGSGIAIDNQGHILTNYHVVDHARRLKVTLYDGRTFNAKVIGTDKLTDLAVLKIEHDSNNSSNNNNNNNNNNPDNKAIDSIPSAELGDSDNLKVGQIVIAVGNPFGLTGGPTVTTGIISSLNRNIEFEDGVLELVQTDAAINPGNSGGPLVNTNGEVIAINTAKIPYAHGIGFAVPVNTAKTILQQLIKNGKVTRPWLGITTIKITSRIARYYRLPTNEGALVVKVEEYSPASDSGIRPGDIIEEIDEKRIEEITELSSRIKHKNVNEQTLLSVNRYGRRFTISVTLENQP
ncbi:MAG: trypsin-like peptidase domain-containing protein [Nitrososphaeraceae archaeon]|nr:trypsin-like peptidase domain-containing protein [Nitrososphaeraceae archaeon]MDW3610648.1 trypsin-like peptidase domain-containing protein [Nitrososphaeraceae archaeon]MDW3626782.1 trypsin-like peptidase domain-containing protein [Nitrososphaeraceae archaeon]